eukprot:40193-Pelagomonas_calceolata.AAC.1
MHACCIGQGGPICLWFEAVEEEGWALPGPDAVNSAFSCPPVSSSRSALSATETPELENPCVLLTFAGWNLRACSQFWTPK